MVNQPSLVIFSFTYYGASKLPSWWKRGGGDREIEERGREKGRVRVKIGTMESWEAGGGLRGL